MLGYNERINVMVQMNKRITTKREGKSKRALILERERQGRRRG
jgi:hypothetical protein